jgi:hypothetical protein
MTETIDDPVGLDEFLDAYVAASIWGSADNGNGGEPLDRNHDASDLAPETLAKMRADCAAFLEHRLGGRLISIAEGLSERGHWVKPGRCSIVEQAGHDFWLSRNGHGCGYWDGDWPKGVGEALDRLAKEFGEHDLYVGDDGLIYGQ